MFPFLQAEPTNGIVSTSDGTRSATIDGTSDDEQIGDMALHME
jgi:hypothetical protein